MWRLIGLNSLYRHLIQCVDIRPQTLALIQLVIDLSKDGLRSVAACFHLKMLAVIEWGCTLNLIFPKHLFLNQLVAALTNLWNSNRLADCAATISCLRYFGI